MRILVAQGNLKIADRIKYSLLAEGFDVDTAIDGEAVLWQASEGNHSAIILDILLAKINGFDVCQTLRNNGIRTPILMVSTKSTTEDEIDSLDAGADDFLRIPFSSPLFLARVKALLRRRRSRDENNAIAFGSLCYNQKDRKCSFNEREISLTNREGKVFELLILAEGAVVPKQMLIDQVWGVEFSGNPNIVDVYIGYLRRKICVDIDNIALQTIRGIGYRLVNLAG
jgi:DNA-binding response OmpR family regulator